jgi:hypothetical protein
MVNVAASSDHTIGRKKRKGERRSIVICGRGRRQNRQEASQEGKVNSLVIPMQGD